MASRRLSVVPCPCEVDAEGGVVGETDGMPLRSEPRAGTELTLSTAVKMKSPIPTPIALCRIVKLLTSWPGLQLLL